MVKYDVDHSAEPLRDQIEKCLGRIVVPGLKLSSSEGDVKQALDKSTEFLNKLGTFKTGEIMKFYEILVEMLSFVASAPLLGEACFASSRDLIVDLGNRIEKCVGNLHGVRYPAMHRLLPPTDFFSHSLLSDS